LPQASKQIEPPNWKPLLQDIQAGNCVAFLGAGANIGGAGGFEIPTGVKLAKDLVRHITGLKENDNPEALIKFNPPLDAHKDMLRSGLTDLARVSLHLRDQLGTKDFLDEIRGRLINDACQPAPLLKVLASLPFELIVTTNYDRMMEAALLESKRTFYTVVQPLHGFDEKKGREVNEELKNFNGVRLYKIHGEFPSKPAADAADAAEPNGNDAVDVSPIIITEEDYIRFLTVLPVPYKGVPSWIEGKIKNSRFLFLGYGLEDWDFRTLHEALIAPIPKIQRRTSYAIQWEPPQFWVDYWNNRGVRIYSMDVGQFATDLRRRYDAM
jgi:SIR2-like domain